MLRSFLCFFCVFATLTVLPVFPPAPIPFAVADATAGAGSGPNTPSEPVPPKGQSSLPAENTRPDSRLESALFKTIQAGDWAGAVNLGRELVAWREKTYGNEDPATIAAYSYLALACVRQNLLDEAVVLYERVLTVTEKYLGPDSPDVATAANRLAGALDLKGEKRKALALYQKALAIRQKALGPDHMLTADVMANVAWILDEQGRYSKARPLYEQVVSVREKAARSQPDKNTRLSLATALNNLAHLDVTQGRYDTAINRYERALQIYTQVSGPKAPETANALNNLADALGYLARYEEALPLLKKALAIYEAIYGPDHLSLAAPLNNLALTYQLMARFDQAEEMLLRSKSIREKNLAADDPAIALSIHNLAALYQTLGEFDKAKVNYEDALNRLEAALGPQHPMVASTLASLAGIHNRLGRYEISKKMLERSLRIREKALGPNHPDVAQTLNNLALMYFGQGEFETAAKLLKRCLDMVTAAMGAAHPMAGDVLNALSGVKHSQGSLQEALAYGQRVLAIRKASLGDDHPNVYISLHNLGTLYYDLGQLDTARQYLLSALEGFRRLLGPDHPYCVHALNNLGRISANQGDYRQALEWLARAQEIERKSLDRIMAVSSEPEKLAFLATLRDNLHIFLSLAAFHLAENPVARRTAADMWISRKGIALEAQKRFQTALFNAKNPQTHALLQELARVRSALAELSLFGVGATANADQPYRQKMERLTARKEELEKKAGQISSAFAATRAGASADAAVVSAALPRGSVLVELARVRRYNFALKVSDSGFKEDHYLAFVISSGPKADPSVALIDLGAAETIDHLITGFRQAVINVTGDGRPFNAIAGKLYDLAFAPLLPAIGTSRRILISPDGNLSLIPFELLRTPSGKYLVEDYDISYLAAGRDVVGFNIKRREAVTAGPAVVIGDPDFDLVPAPAGRQDRPDSAPADQAAESETLRSPALNGAHFPDLPATRQEARTVAKLLSQKMGSPNVLLYLGAQAKKSRFFAHANPKILHLATHGFFLPDQELPDTPYTTTRGIGIMAKKPAPVAAQKYLKQADKRSSQYTWQQYVSPLLRSGLALAGANAQPSTAGQNRGGILTAEQVLDLELAGTKLVTLSACETGLGRVLAGEGVFGLRRAFFQAGADGLVMSLWTIPDLETKELMTRFYEALVREGIHTPQALRTAILEQMALVGKRYGHAYPFYWGAFIYLGVP